MTMLKRRHVALLGLFTVGVIACSDSTGLADFDAQQAAMIATELESMSTAVESPEDALSSMELAGQALGFGSSFNVATSVPGEFQISPAALVEVGEVGPAALIPAEYLGVTFVYNETEQWYVQSDRTGAPANGVRIIYYAIDPITDLPASPLNELGYVDLMDVGTDTSERLDVLIVNTSGSTDVTLGDYYIGFTWEETASSFSVDFEAAGYVSDGTTQLDFNLSQSISGSETSGLSMTMDHTLSLPGRDLSVNVALSATVDSQTGELDEMTVAFTVQHGPNTLVMDAVVSFSGDLATIEGTVTFNGALVANISGDVENPTFTKPDGSELTQAEIDALERIFDGVGEVFDFVEHIFM